MTDGHIWIELTTLDDLPERVWMCNAHPGEERREIADPAWLAQKPAADRLAYERMGVQVVEQSPKLLRLAREAAAQLPPEGSQP
jgi:hypothetical protein